MAEHHEQGYNFGHKAKAGMDPATSVTTALSYRAAVRIVNVLEDLHAQMQKPEGERFKGYSIAQFEEVDTYLRDLMVNIAISLELRETSKKTEGNLD
jgi:hypothetical protein